MSTQSKVLTHWVRVEKYSEIRREMSPVGAFDLVGKYES